MRIRAQAVNMELAAELRRAAEFRVWMAVHRSPVRWAGALLERDEAGGPVACRLDAWVREFGLVSARHADPDPIAAVDGAARQLERAIARRARRAGIRPGHDAGAAWRPDESRPGDPTGDDPGIDGASSSEHPFLDYDPVMPNWPR